VHAVGGIDAPVRFSRSCAAFHRVDLRDPQSEFLRWLLDDAPDGAVVLPCDDDAVEVVARHRAEFVPRLIPMEGNDAALLTMLDKDATYAHARAAGVPVPVTMVIENQADVDAAIELLGFPCALKPRHTHEFARHFRRKVFVAEDAQALRLAFADTSAHGLAMIVTEIIPGPESSYCSMYTYLDERSEPLFLYTKRKLRQYPPGFGIGTYHMTHWDPAVAEMGLRLLQSAGFRGLANVEFKRDSRDGSLKLIECNARFTAANELLNRSGLDLAHFVYRRQLGEVVELPARARDGVYMWSPITDTLAFVAAQRDGDLTLRDWIASLLHPQHTPLFSWRDPGPSAFSLYYMSARTGRRLLQRRTPDAPAADAAVA
jgi:predicted ATP-grasp superfamily ATP-dependent carboligase